MNIYKVRSLIGIQWSLQVITLIFCYYNIGLLRKKRRMGRAK